MSETKSESSSKRRRFTEEFKQNVVRPVVVEKYLFEAATAAAAIRSVSLCRLWAAPRTRIDPSAKIATAAHVPALYRLPRSATHGLRNPYPWGD